MTGPAPAELPLFNRLVYASGSLGGNVISRSRDLWLIFFYAPPGDADIAERVPILALIMGALALASRYIALAGAWRHTRLDVEPATVGPWQAVRATFRNDQFLFYLPTFILFNMAISMMTAALPFWAGAVLLRGFPKEIAELESGHEATLKVLGLEVGVATG